MPACPGLRLRAGLAVTGCRLPRGGEAPARGLRLAHQCASLRAHAAGPPVGFTIIWPSQASQNRYPDAKPIQVQKRPHAEFGVESSGVGSGRSPHLMCIVLFCLVDAWVNGMMMCFVGVASGAGSADSHASFVPFRVAWWMLG